MDASKVLQIVLGALFVAFIGFQAWLANTLVAVQGDTKDRLTKIETTIGENKREREDQITDLRERMRQMEARVYRGDGRER